MKRTKQILSVFLSFCMIISCMVGMSVTASAAAYATYLVESTDTSDTLPNKVVHFNSKDWYIIKDESTAVNTGTVTLLAADTSFGVSEFHNSNNTYSTSTIKSNLDTLTTTGTFKDVADAIKDTENGKLYILSIDETQQLSSNVLIINFSGGDCSSGEWWLRSPDPNSPNYAGHAAIVIGNSGEISGANIGWLYGVRPALQLDLSKVTFDSETKTFTVKSAPSTPTWESGDCLVKLDGTTITVTKKEGNGDGKMADYASYTDRPWHDNRENITSVNIGEGVTSIGKNAFRNCKYLSSVTIPNNVMSIGESAFQGCMELPSVTIPSSVISIGKSAFALCRNLGSVTIPSGVISIGEATFTGCDKLASVTIPNSVTSIDKSAFSVCKSLTSVTIPSSVTSIGNDAFSNCSNLATVTFEPRSAEAITTNPTLTIGKYAFDRTKNGAAVAYGTGDAALFDDTTEIKAGDLLTTIYSTSAKTLTWKAASSDIAWTNGNVIGILDGTKLTVAKKDDAQNGDMGNEWTAVTEGGATWDSKKATITEVEIQDGVTSIGNKAFKECSALTSVSIPDSVKSIGGSAFSDCAALVSITIPDSVTSIGPNSFDSCANLTSVDIPNSVTSIGYSAFQSCTALTSVTISNSLTSISSNMFGFCTSLASVTIPNGVTSIGDNAFQTCTALTSVSIPDSVTSIGEEAFWRCKSLTSVSIPDSVTSIGEEAFWECKALTSVTIPGSVTSIGKEAFEYCEKLATVTFEPRSTEDIQSNATLTIGEDAFFDTVEGAKVAYGIGDTVLYDGENEITTDTLLTDIQDKTLTWKESTYTITMKNGGTASVDGNTVTKAPKGATVEIVAPVPERGTEFNGWTSEPKVTFADADSDKTTFTMPASNVDIYASFQNIAYKITMRNGGTAYVDGKKATTAEAGTVVTVKAGSSGTSARFNGWTTTTEGVEFADADSAETTFKMPMSDVEISASFEGVEPYIPSYSPSNTSTTTTTTANAPAETMTFEGEETISHTNLLSWSGVSGASSYLISVKKDGKFVPLAKTTKTNIDVVHAYNGKYYVSEGGKYTAYTYKDGKFVKGGTITAAQADKLVKANNVTDTYMLQYTKNGKLSSEKSALTVSVKVYYKPAVKASSKDGKVVLKWKKVVGAEKYRIYKYEGGKLTKIADTTANAVRISKVTAGKTYKYAVKAYVDGKWTKVTKSDIVSVKVK